MFKRIVLCLSLAVVGSRVAPAQERFEGAYYRGEGDVAYLKLLDISRRMFAPDPEFQHMPMLYTPAWNGFVEGPTWGAWWIQNSYGTTYCALPFYTEPYVTFLQNAQDLWFSQMGDGQRKSYKDWVAPDGCLCDAASPGSIIYKQGDGRTDIHDWAIEFTAAGVVLQSELLLIGRDNAAIERYIPLLERSANFIETRRDTNNLFLAGPAGNLLAPSYAGWKKPDGTYDKAYLAGLSVTYIAALDRLIKLEKMLLREDKVSLYTDRRDRARQGLPQLMVDEGTYFLKSIDPDGTKHGVYGAPEHGYFEASPNHDAMAFRIVDDDTARRIYDKIASIPLLRRHDLICANEPGLDDMYQSDKDWLWKHGTWVNGGHWSTCEARMILGYYRVGQYDDARRSMEAILKFARQFRMDNPLVNFGAAVYQPKEPVNLCYDTFGPPAAMVRGLFEYIYGVNDLTLYPHIPDGITRLEQRFPIRFGAKKIYLATLGTGQVSSVLVNGMAWDRFDPISVTLPYTDLPDNAQIVIGLGDGDPIHNPVAKMEETPLALPPAEDPFWNTDTFFESAGKNGLPLRIGADSKGENPFSGKIRRVRIYAQVVTDEKVLEGGGKSKSDESLLAQWDFDRSEEGNALNKVEQGPAAKITSGAEIADKALTLKEKGWAEVEPGATFDLPDAFTLSAEVSPAKLPKASARIIDKITAGADDGYCLDMLPSGGLRLITRRGTLQYDSPLPLNKWSVVAATFDAKGELCLYLNGGKVASAPARVPQPPVSMDRVRAFYLAMAQSGAADSYEGRHARVIIEELSSIRQRQQLQSQGKLPPLPGPSQAAADKSYVDTFFKLQGGFAKTLDDYANSNDAQKKSLCALWNGTRKP